MIREKNSEIQDWKELFADVRKIMTLKNWNRSSIFGDIEKHFKTIGQNVDEKTLGKYFKEYEDIGSLPNKSKIASVGVSELSAYLRTEYADVLNDKFHFDNFDYYYIYYYQGSQEYIKPAIICLKINDDEFGDGVIYYLSKDKNGYKYNSTFTLTRSSPAEGKKKNHKFIFYQAISDEYPDQVNFFTFNVAERPFDKRFLFFLTCNAISNTNLGRVASTNFGVVKKVEKQFIITEIQAVTDPWITNILIGKRISFGGIETSVFTTEEKFLTDKKSDSKITTTNLQYTCCNILKGYYIGIYPRNEIPATKIIDNGGIAFVIMEFSEDGNSTISFSRSSNKNLVSYSGVFHFPYDDYKIVKGDFESMKPQVFRFSLYLTKLEDSNKLGGIFSGFKEPTPFASPIIFYKLTDNIENVTAIIEKYKPGRINKNDIPYFFQSVFGNDSENWLKRVKDDLFQLSKKHFETPDNCFLK